MNYFAPTRVRVEKNSITRVTRVLKGKGSINVSLGQIVEPSQIIGNATLSAGFRIINIAKLLKVQPLESEKYLTHKLGQKIYKGELLACKPGRWLGRKEVVVAPTDGVLDFFSNKTGELKIILIPQKKDLPAGVYGVVEEVDEQRGKVVIRTQADTVYGVLGSGRSRDGILHILSKQDGLVSRNSISDVYHGQILVGGSMFFRDAIIASISTGVEGIITGGIDADDYKSMAGGRLIFPQKLETDVGICIVACEGFGSIPIGRDIFEELLRYEGKFVFISGKDALINLPFSASSCLAKIKSTSLPPVQSKTGMHVKQITSQEQLKVGLKVRIVGNSYLGEVGKIVGIDQSKTLLASGLNSFLATVETARRKIQVPVANIEIIV